jgi:protein O-GlcNAc transferase
LAKFTLSQALETAARKAKTGNASEAKAIYNNILKKFPNHKGAQKALEALTPESAKATMEPLAEDSQKLLDLCNRRQFIEAIQLAQSLRETFPRSFFLWNVIAGCQASLGELDKALIAMKKAVELNPTHAESYNNIGSIFERKGKFNEAIASYKRALELKPNYLLVCESLADVLHERGQLDEAVDIYKRALKLKPDHPEILINLGIALRELRNPDEAVTSFKRALELKSDYPQAHNNLGIALKDQGKLDEAVTSFKRALELKSDYPQAHNNLGIVLKDQGKLDEAVTSLKRALELNPDCAETNNELGIVLQTQGKLVEAVASYKRALAIRPNYAEANNNLGSAFLIQGKVDKSVASCKRALAIRPDYADANYNLGNALQVQGKLDEAVKSYRRALAIRPDYADAEIQMLHQQQKICDFAVYLKMHETTQRLNIDAGAVAPFIQLSWEDNAACQLKRSQKHASANYLAQTKFLMPRPVQFPKRLKVGYFSADFHDHATLHLLAGVLRHHDRSKFEIHAFSYGHDKSGKWRQGAPKNVEYFHDVANYSDDQIVKLSRLHKIDIAIDLKGYTAQTRSGLFQYRLAPIQINYLGYPGSMGAEFMDYLIADPFVIPDTQRQFYSEKIIYLPDCYQPTDDMREIAQIVTKREDFGLPKKGFVFCCFNNNYKISTREFDIWMRLLAKVEGSVLWLFESNKWATENLQKEAQKRGVEKHRLVFAKRLSQSEHLARQIHADLFVDTFNYNAHTTASDALWAGLPVLTKAGQQFAARVAASILHAIDMPELIAKTEADYEQLALQLASVPTNHKATRDKLINNIKSKPLFDTERYTRNLESGLHLVYNNYYKNEMPKDIWISKI